MADFLMPTLGADMSEGTLLAWRKKPGDPVRRGEIIAEVDTEKAAIEIEAFTTGVLEKVLVQPGEKVSVGTVMAIIREEEKPVEAAAAAPAIPTIARRAREGPVKDKELYSREVVTHQISTAPRLRISPSAKQLAAELGVDPA